MAICLDRCAYDLHIVQLLPLPPYHLLLHSNPEQFNLFGASLPRMTWKEAVKLVSVCLISDFLLWNNINVLLLQPCCIS